MFSRRFGVAAILAASGALCAEAAAARGVSPYLPLHLSPEIERQVERLLILADKPVMRRPIAAATVFDALPAGCERDPVLCEQVKRYLSSFMRTAGVSHLSAAVAGTSGSAPALPNRHGMSADSSYEVAAAAYWQPGDYMLVSAGAVANEGDSTPTGSVLSFGMEYAQVDVGYRDHWLSPFTDSAMLVSTEAATMPSVTLSNYTPISRWGFGYELFVAEMSESNRIVGPNNDFTTGKPRLLGFSLSIEPFPGWALGVSRIMQYGGGDRDASFSDAVDAFFNPADVDNTGTPADFGNQIAAFSSRFLMPTSVPFAVYFEYAGEDTSTLSNLRLGNSALSIGLDFPLLFQNLSLTVEMSEWQNLWYVHHIYQDGMTNHGRVLGHWGADWRESGDGVGARSVMARVGWTRKSGGLFEATYRNIDNEAYSGRAYETGHDLEVRYSHPWNDFYFGAELNTGRDVFGESYTRLGAFFRF